MANDSADRLIKRINALHQSLQLEPDNPPSAMERDLMLSYLRDLYEIYSDAPRAQPQAPTPPPPPARAMPAPPPPPAAPAPTPPAPAPAPNISPEVAKLFAETEGNDLAARLGKQPIRDLTRALTINNRVLFTNALFEGNTEQLNNTLRTLNSIGGMQGAKPILQDLAMRHRWGEEDKREAAREFIELVKRRYA